MSISSRAVALIRPKPLDPEKAKRYTHMRFGSRWNPPIFGIFGTKRNAEAYFGPVPVGIDAWIDVHITVFYAVMAGCASYAVFPFLSFLI